MKNKILKLLSAAIVNGKNKIVVIFEINPLVPWCPVKGHNY